MDSVHPVDAVHDALIAKGCSHLCNEVIIVQDGIRPPRRRLTAWEAVAMAAAWRDGYAAMCAPTCNHSVPRVCSYCDCPEGAVPNMENEQIAAAWMTYWANGERASDV